MKQNLKSILIDTVLRRIVHDYIYYNKDYITTLQLNFTDEVIRLFNSHIFYPEIQQAIKNGLKLKAERGYY